MSSLRICDVAQSCDRQITIQLPGFSHRFYELIWSQNAGIPYQYRALVSACLPIIIVGRRSKLTDHQHESRARRQICLQQHPQPASPSLFRAFSQPQRPSTEGVHRMLFDFKTFSVVNHNIHSPLAFYPAQIHSTASLLSLAIRPKPRSNPT